MNTYDYVQELIPEAPVWAQEQLAQEIDRLRADIELLRGANMELRGENVRLRAEVERLRAGIAAVDYLINESNGVVGLHLNGDVAYWDDLRTGGKFEAWLLDFDEALRGEGG